MWADGCNSRNFRDTWFVLLQYIWSYNPLTPQTYHVRTVFIRSPPKLLFIMFFGAAWLVWGPEGALTRCGFYCVRIIRIWETYAVRVNYILLPLVFNLPRLQKLQDITNLYSAVKAWTRTSFEVDIADNATRVYPFEQEKAMCRRSWSTSRPLDTARGQLQVASLAFVTKVSSPNQLPTRLNSHFILIYHFNYNRASHASRGCQNRG